MATSPYDRIQSKFVRLELRAQGRWECSRGQRSSGSHLSTASLAPKIKLTKLLFSQHMVCCWHEFPPRPTMLIGVQSKPTGMLRPWRLMPSRPSCLDVASDDAWTPGSALQRPS
jgi:hypothetical protein